MLVGGRNLVPILTGHSSFIAEQQEPAWNELHKRFTLYTLVVFILYTLYWPILYIYTIHTI